MHNKCIMQWMLFISALRFGSSAEMPNNLAKFMLLRCLKDVYEHSPNARAVWYFVFQSISMKSNEQHEQETTFLIV